MSNSFTNTHEKKNEKKPQKMYRCICVTLQLKYNK